MNNTEYDFNLYYPYIIKKKQVEYNMDKIKHELPLIDH